MLGAALGRSSPNGSRRWLPPTADEAGALGSLPSLAVGQARRRDARHNLFDRVDDDAAGRAAALHEGEVVRDLVGVGREVGEPEVNAAQVGDVLRLVDGEWVQGDLLVVRELRVQPVDELRDGRGHGTLECRRAVAASLHPESAGSGQSSAGSRRSRRSSSFGRLEMTKRRAFSSAPWPKRRLEGRLSGSANVCGVGWPRPVWR